MTTSALANLSVDQLRADLDGRLLLPGEPGYAEARLAWNLSVDQQPAAVVEAAGVADVQATLRHAHSAGVRVAPQSTGHGAEGLAPLSDAILLKTTALDDVTIDVGTRTARVGAGATAGAVAAAASEHGLAAVLGLAPTVGVAGLALGGGLGWLSRMHGLAANNIVALDAVTADGQLHTVDADTEPDLFWALRGGGARAAVVTELTLRLHPVAAVSAGMLAWPVEAAGDLIEQVRVWSADLPDTLGAVLRVVSLPPIDALPEPIRGRRIVAVAAAYFGPHDDAARIVAPLRAAHPTLLDTFGPIEPAQLVRVAGDPEQPGPARGDGLLLTDLTPQVVSAVSDIVDDGTLDALGVLELRLLGGALRHAPEGHGALARIDGGWAFFAAGLAPEPAALATVLDQLAEVRRRLSPFAADQVLLNSAPAGVDPARAFTPDAWERLNAIRDAHDPAHTLLGHHDGTAT